MTETKIIDAGKWLKRRDAWLRMLVSNPHVSRNAKVVGVYLAMRMSAKRPFTYPGIKLIAKAIDTSPRHVSRALSELELELFIRVERPPGKVPRYRLDL